MVTSGWRAWALFLYGLVLVLCSSVCLSQQPHVTPADCSRKEHPVVSYQALRPWVSEFSHPGVKDFSQLALDLSRNQLVVGARNFIFRLSLSNASLIQATEWSPDEDTKRSCQSKGKSEEECQNYIRVLLISGTTLFTCGTNAFTPVCITRQVGNVSRVLDTVNGVARCPYDPRHNSTAMVTERGELYAATVIDFSGRDPVIYRSLGNMPPLRTAQYNSKWLNEPHFVSVYEIGRFAYFFLRETAVENDCGKMVFSRVARVCKNDMGGRFLLEDTWTTFMKARLNCSRSGEIPFYYNELQSTFYLPEQDLIYGIFTTNVNSISASAVCAFNLSSITQAFNGPFRYQENPRTAWLSTPNPIPNFQCGTLEEGGPGENLTERSLQDAQRLFLMNDVVQPVTVNPLLTQDNLRFSKMVVDIVQGRDTLYHVMYIGTEYGTILKALSTTNKSLQGCYLEELRILPERHIGPIRSLRILHSDRSLFVGLNDRLVKIPLERCSSYPTERHCMEARDPYCGWDLKQKRCTTIEESSNMNQWTQNITECPVRNLTQDGGFGPWAPWQPCNHDDGEGSVSSCACRSRSCDGPVARCGGVQCKGSTIQVANCSRNGGWTPWSSWGQCSSSCGIGFEVRQRSCNNPSPRHGGRICVGQGREERLCNEKKPCPLPVLWTAWEPWAHCSAECGGGVHSRTRSCENGNSCPGCSTEYKACNLEACPEVRRNTPWTPWMPVNVSHDGSRQEQRFRYTCRALLPDPQQLQMGKKKLETRFCPNDGSGACQTDSLVEDLVKTSGRTLSQPQGVRWGSWETWSSCSQQCSRGFRTRKRSCSTAEGRTNPSACVGSPVEYQDCNNQPCPVSGAWSCWSSWSQCSASCGGGHYQRTRTCTNPPPAAGGDICIGLHTEEALCSTHACQGWGEWTDWGDCDEDGLQHRTRHCSEEQEAEANLCQGNITQSRPCQPHEVPVILPGQEDQSCGTFTLFQLVAVGSASFFVAALLSALAYSYCHHLNRPSAESAVIHPSTPNHLTYNKQGNTTPKNEKYIPMEFKTLNKNNLHVNDETCNHFSSPLPSSNMFTATYYPTSLSKYDFHPDSPCRTYMHS
ncbi:semaphorin-5B [Larimichthys crocea]|uniref:semaphorin-5B n=1 Tax=Larimichthys crocea TaxID=215358 RepID=UPI000F5E8081|nr:semaphorin-5B [Larimichthys crocea]XP_027147375.1 semaphorin-5B [Larimichthys crocea]XP_027147376.1 semaphorin-5B [Larimichthys crocea]XP_027147377.1 semaphorin-5B [Larimichthys crocea]